jgi:hypothetical protein
MQHTAKLSSLTLSCAALGSHPWKGLVQLLPISGAELSATDAWLGAVVDDGTYMGLVCQAYAARAAIVLTN